MSEQEHLSISLYQGVPHDCNYLSGRTATLHIVDPEFPVTPLHYSYLLFKGFRRSGEIIYRPACENCNACRAARLSTSLFTPDRSQKRCGKRNQDIEIYITRPNFKERHLQLYKKYLGTRHRGGEMTADNIDDMEQFLLSSWSEIELIEGWLDDELVMVAVTDVTPNGLSAIYTFFDPELSSRSLGTYGILRQIDRCRELGLPHLYLGYWIAECQKMAYKENFRPLEILDMEGRWQQLESP